MDAIKKRREYLQWEAEQAAEKKRIEFLKQMKQETMKSNVISQRIILQEYLIEKESQITADIEQWLNDEEKLKTLDKAQTEKLILEWLGEFNLIQPS